MATKSASGTHFKFVLFISRRTLSKHSTFWLAFKKMTKTVDRLRIILNNVQGRMVSKTGIEFSIAEIPNLAMTSCMR